MKDYVEAFLTSYRKQMKILGETLPVLDTQFDEEKDSIKEAVYEELKHLGYEVIIGEDDGYVTVKLSRKFVRARKKNREDHEG